MTSFSLRPAPPFDFALSAAIFSQGDEGIRIFRNGTFRYAFMTSAGPVLAEVRSGGTTDRPRLNVTLSAGTDCTRAQAGEARATLSRVFSTRDDLRPFYAAMEDDPVLSGLTRRLYGLAIPVTPTVFEALADSIIEQQISLAAARAVENRLIRLAGERVAAEDGTPWYCYPAPSALAILPESGYRACGLTARKGEYLRGISRMIAGGDLDLEALRHNPDTESIIGELVAIRGVGRWTAELTILRGLHRPDAFPADDVGVRRFISQGYFNHTRITPEEAREFAGRWGEWKGFAAYYLEVADLLGICPAAVPGKTPGRA